MQSYLDLVREVLTRGESRQDRTGVGTLALFGRSLRFDLSAGFPATTVKRLAFATCMTELCWWLRGESSVKFLRDRGVKIWDAWASDRGELGPVYGVQWRRWPSDDLDRHAAPIDQVQQLLTSLRQQPHGRRHLVSAWNVAQLEQMALPPCHLLFQCYVSNDERLSLQVYQRSSDLFLGVPFDIAAYAALTHVLAARLGLEVGELIWLSGDTHIYLNHLEQVQTMLTREPRPLPRLRLHDAVRHVPIGSLLPEYFTLDGYDPHPHLAAPIAV